MLSQPSVEYFINPSSFVTYQRYGFLCCQSIYQTIGSEEDELFTLNPSTEVIDYISKPLIFGRDFCWETLKYS